MVPCVGNFVPSGSRSRESRQVGSLSERGLDSAMMDQANVTTDTNGDAMAQRSEEALSVYRLMPSMSEYKGLNLNSDDVQRLMRWQRSGAETDRPTRLRAEWLGEQRWPKSEFPSGRAGAPVLSRRLVEGFGEGLAATGSLIPVDIVGSNGDEYFLYLVEQVVDVWTYAGRPSPRRWGEVKKAVYRPEGLPAQFPAFRLPQFPRAVQWIGWAAERLVEFTGDQIEPRLTWSQDPTAKSSS